MAFYSSIEMNIEDLEAILDRTELEEKRLKVLKSLILEENCIEKYFAYKDIYLFDNYKKMFLQVKEINPKFDTFVMLHFYSLAEKSNVPIGEINEYGKINTGSQLFIDSVTVDAEQFYYFYKMQLN